MFVVQILEGNARKVSIVRFKHINHDDAASEVTHLVPKIMKGKWSNTDYSDREEINEVPFQEIQIKMATLIIM